MSAPLTAPVVKSLVVARSAADAFRLFTEDLGKWWPHATHSLGGDKVADVVMEARTGGRIYERWRDGTEKLWGTVIGARCRTGWCIRGMCRPIPIIHQRSNCGSSR